jgi:hypothetical protein
MTRAQSFKQFLSCFSIEEFPITFSDENITYFSSKNKVLPPELIRRFILQGNHEVEEEIDDEMTEYIACCLIANSNEMHAVVYWKGALLRYEYILATYDKNGVLIARKVISGIRSDGKNVQTSVAIMDDEWMIDIMVGELAGSDTLYNPQNSKPMSMELLANGEIIFSLQE